MQQTDPRTTNVNNNSSSRAAAAAAAQQEAQQQERKHRVYTMYNPSQLHHNFHALLCRPGYTQEGSIKSHQNSQLLRPAAEQRPFPVRVRSRARSIESQQRIEAVLVINYIQACSASAQRSSREQEV